MGRLYVKLGLLALMTAAVWLSIILLVRGMGTVFSLFIEDDYISAVLFQLRSADIRVPIWIPLIIGGAYCLLPWKREWRGRLILSGVLIFLASFILCLYFTKVNSVPFGIAVRIVTDIFTSGILGEIS
jgi:ABC-type sulfate transport system permease subunit